MTSKFDRVEGLRESILSSINEGRDFLEVIIGQEDAKEKLLASLLAGHHVLIEGPPGVGKTTLAKHIASSLPVLETVQNCPYHCSPDDPVCPSCKSKLNSNEKNRS